MVLYVSHTDDNMSFISAAHVQSVQVTAGQNEKQPKCLKCLWTAVRSGNEINRQLTSVTQIHPDGQQAALVTQSSLTPQASGMLL